MMSTYPTKLHGTGGVYLNFDYLVLFDYDMSCNYEVS